MSYRSLTILTYILDTRHIMWEILTDECELSSAGAVIG